MSKKSKDIFTDPSSVFSPEPMFKNRKDFYKAMDEASKCYKKNEKKERRKDKKNKKSKKKKLELLPITNDVQATNVKISDSVSDAEPLQRLPVDGAVLIFNFYIINHISESSRNEIVTDDYVVTDEESHNE